MQSETWAERIRRFAEERSWSGYHSPKNLAMALSVEVAELVEIFQWLETEESAQVMADPERAQAVRDEVADVMTYLLRLVDVLDIDLDAAMADTLAEAEQRYPVGSLPSGLPGSGAGPDGRDRPGDDAPDGDAHDVGTSAPGPLEVLAPVLGVDACRAGWVGALLEPGAPRPRVVVAETLEELLAAAGEQLRIAVAAVDIPIGLPDDGAREADRLARAALPGRSSSVFTTPTRAATVADSYEAANAANREAAGQGISQQAWGITRKIREADALVRVPRDTRIVEAHPELSFATMAGAPMRHAKRAESGAAERLAALAAVGIGSPSVLSGSGYAADDVLDACAVAWTAARVASGRARPLPEEPQVHSDGIPAAIWA